MKKALFLYAAVVIGGTLGTLVRMLSAGSLFTYLLVPNLMACALMGASCCLLARLKLSQIYRQAVNAGFLGGLSTYASPVLVQLTDGAITLDSFIGVMLELLSYWAVSGLGWGAGALCLRLYKRSHAQV